jgi:hypothetical protein
MTSVTSMRVRAACFDVGDFADANGAPQDFARGAGPGGVHTDTVGTKVPELGPLGGAAGIDANGKQPE